MKTYEQIKEFQTSVENELTDQSLILSALHEQGVRLLTRENGLMHMTASSIIVTPDCRDTLMAFHNIYQSWAWTGGHTDGEDDLLAVALREAQEETGIDGLTLPDSRVQSVEILPVYGHIKRGKYVSTHLHLNASFIFFAEKDVPIRKKADENAAVAWLPVDRLQEYVTEADMLPIYQKLLRRAGEMRQGKS